MKFFNKKLLLFLIILLGAFLRFYKLGEIPNGIYVDEAALGYNAFTFTQTGRDEYGQLMSIFLRSFGAFSSPLYAYLSALPVALFGLSAFSIRFLSAVSGVLTILVIYLIVDKFFDYKNKHTALFTALIFAISPWSIFFSRGAFEANLGLLLLSVAVYLMLFPRKIKYLVISVILLGFSAYAYQSLRLIPMFLIPAHYFLFRDKVYNFKRALLVFGIFLVIIFPQIIISTTPAFGVRASGLFYSDAINAQADKIFLPGFVSIILAFIREFGSQLASYFSPSNLFLQGDPDPQRSIPETTLFSLWVLPLYLIGLFVLAKRIPNKKANFVFVMMVVFAAPAALARDPFSSLRALNLLIPFCIVIALGLDSLLNKTGVKVGGALIIILSLFSLVSLWRGYFVLLPGERASVWDYGYKELADELTKTDEHFVIDPSRMEPPHILLAFYLKIPAREYQEFAKFKIIKGYYEDTEFDTYYKLRNFETRPIDWETDIYKKQILVGDELAISQEQVAEHFLEKVFEIHDPLKKIIFQGYRTNPIEKCNNIIRNLLCP